MFIREQPKGSDMPTLDLSTLMNDGPQLMEPREIPTLSTSTTEILEPLKNFLVEHLRSIGGHAALVDAKRAAYQNLRDLKQRFEHCGIAELKDALNVFSDQFEWGRSRLYGGRLAVGIKGVLRVSEATFFSDTDDSQEEEAMFTEDEDEDQEKPANEPEPLVLPPLPPPKPPSSNDHLVLILDIDKTLIDYYQISHEVIKKHFDKILALCRSGDEKGGPAACVIYRPARAKKDIRRAYEVPRRTQLEESKLYLYQVEKITNDPETGIWLIKKRPHVHHFLQVCSRRFHEMRVASQAGPEWLTAVIPFIDPEREFFELPQHKTENSDKWKNCVVSFANVGQGPRSDNAREKELQYVCPDLVEFVGPENKIKWREGVKFWIIDDYPEVWSETDRPKVRHVSPCNFFENWYNVGYGWNGETREGGHDIPVDKDDALLRWLDATADLGMKTDNG